MHTIKYIEKLAKETLSEKRYIHTLAVAKLAKELALKYGEDVERVEMAALLHDMTKEIPMKEQRKSLKVSNPSVDYDQLADNCIHSITGYYYAKDELKIEDEEIINAILYHTTGRAGMTLLEKIIFVADKTSYDRDYPEVIRLRGISFVNLDDCMVEILVFLMQSLLKKKKTMVIDTINCYNHLVCK